MKKIRGVEIGVLCGLFFLDFLVAVLQHDPQIKTLDQAGFALTLPTTENKTKLMRFLTDFGSPQFIGSFTILLMLGLWWQKKIGASMWYGAMQFGGALLVSGIKNVIVRPRPTPRLDPIGGYSFPSGHTVGTTILVLTLLSILWPYVKNRWIRILLVILGSIWILIIMYTRVYLHAHYPSDVWAGLLLALSWWLITNSKRQDFLQWISEIQK